jgi:UDP-GlcNAc:undecaprenyl-phosphate/decaprenyl-phosphate GlcNAc-1-phosphate transferase
VGEWCWWPGSAWWALAGDGGDSSVHLAAVVLVVGFGLLGWIDDVHGHGHEKGFRGHLAALARGRLTTGGLKLVGGGVLALAAGALLHGDRGAVEVIIDGALIASAANLGNLFDRRPGRVIKVSLLAGAALVVAAGASPDLVPVAAVLGAAVALLPADLGERIMLGDTGSNVLGAVLGLGVVATAGPGVRSVVLVIVVLLNAASEIVSFSRVIEATPPLRALDRLGRSR